MPQLEPRLPDIDFSEREKKLKDPRLVGRGAKRPRPPDGGVPSVAAEAAGRGGGSGGAQGLIDSGNVDNDDFLALPTGSIGANNGDGFVANKVRSACCGHRLCCEFGLHGAGVG